MAPIMGIFSARCKPEFSFTLGAALKEGVPKLVVNILVRGGYVEKCKFDLLERTRSVFRDNLWSCHLCLRLAHLIYLSGYLRMFPIKF
jgi:hypothetical protein